MHYELQDTVISFCTFVVCYANFYFVEVEMREYYLHHDLEVSNRSKHPAQNFAGTGLQLD